MRGRRHSLGVVAAAVAALLHCGCEGDVAWQPIQRGVPQKVESQTSPSLLSGESKIVRSLGENAARLQVVWNFAAPRYSLIDINRSGRFTPASWDVTSRTSEQPTVTTETFKTLLAAFGQTSLNAKVFLDSLKVYGSDATCSLRLSAVVGGEEQFEQAYQELKGALGADSISYDLQSIEAESHVTHRIARFLFSGIRAENAVTDFERFRWVPEGGPTEPPVQDRASE